ncbi:class I SAM-dependent methyltransferase [Flavobacterium sp. J372]|nr:class I SAM-dependent methyltransferase [Flavobacterium sp. J372]
MEEKASTKEHWENIYTTKSLESVSWYQPVPETSLEMITKYAASKDAAIIDMGGGDSFLSDHLLNLGYTDITVLDISEAAIARAKERLGEKADKVKWIVSDAANFLPERKYDIWHDRAAFHFLTAGGDISNYTRSALSGIAPDGMLILGTFSENGPKKCSGIDIRQYSEKSMKAMFQDGFEPIECFASDHRTPFDTVQNFTFCVFRKH